MRSEGRIPGGDAKVDAGGGVDDGISKDADKVATSDGSVKDDVDFVLVGVFGVGIVKVLGGGETCHADVEGDKTAGSRFLCCDDQDV